MRSRSSSACWLFLAAAFAQPPAPQPPPEKPASISGDVRNSVTGEPIAHAHVVLTADMRDNRLYGAYTGPDGKFSLTFPAGGYGVRVEHTGFVDLNGQERRAVAMNQGEKKENFNLKLTPTAAIAGRVLDPGGAPAEGIAVVAEIAGRQVRWATTDDRGAYRIGGLRPGKYRVKAQPAIISGPPEIRTDGSAETHYAQTWYPDALDAKSASRVEIGPAIEAAGIDIHLVRIPIIHLAGKIFGKPSDAEQVTLSLEPQAMGVQVRQDGSFEVWRINPGHYTLTAKAFTHEGDPWSSPPVEVDIGQADVENIALQLMPAADVQGSIEFDDDDAKHPQRPPGDGKPEPLRLILRDSDARFNLTPVEIAADGSFKLTRILPDRYRATLNDQLVYVKSVRIGGVVSPGPWIDLTAGAGAPITLQVASAKGKITGTVRDSQGPVAGSGVLLTDDGPRFFGMSIHRTNAEGVYTFTGISPGKYKLIAIAIDDAGSLIANPAIGGTNLEDFEDITEKIEIGEAETVTRDLKRK